MVVYEKNIFITIIFITDNEPTLEFVYLLRDDHGLVSLQ